MADTDQGNGLPHGEVLDGETDPSSEEDRRPTPVRMAMEGGDDEDDGRSDASRTVRDDESGADWVVTVSGRSASGILPLRTIPLMELTFAEAEDPGQPIRQVLHSANELAALSDDELLSLLKRSDPYRTPMKARGEKDGRGRKGKGGRPGLD